MPIPNFKTYKKMQILKINRKYKNFTRLIKIITIVGKYGFSFFLRRIHPGLAAIPDRFLNIRQERSLKKLTEPERVRLAIEELGPAFIKMGQILSLRPDIIPPEYAKELEKLLDRTPPVPFEAIRGVIEQEFGEDIHEIFERIEEKPIASGSIAQVQKAVLKEEKETVAVKVLKPKTREIIETDLSIIQLLVRLASNYIPELQVYNPAQTIQEFSEILLSELNFLREANNIERFSKFFKGEDYIHVPKIYKKYTTSRVMVMEFIDGIKVTDVESLEKADMNRREISENGAKIVLKEIFEFNFFHADPHPGNIFVLAGNVIAPVDFGITGYIDEEGIQIIGNILLGLLNRDVEKIIRYLKRYNFVREDVDERKLKIDLYDLMDSSQEITLSQINFSSSIQTIFQMTKKYQIRFPSEYFLIFKTLLQVDGVGRMLYPDFNVTEYAKSHVKKWFLKQYSPIRYVKEVFSLLDDINYFLKSLPDELRFIMKRTLSGKLRIPIYHENLDRAVSEIDRIGNRLSFAILIASLLLSSSILVQAKIGPFIRGYPVFGIAGFFGAAIMGIWLLIGIIRSGRL